MTTDLERAESQARRAVDQLSRPDIFHRNATTQGAGMHFVVGKRRFSTRVAAEDAEGRRKTRRLAPSAMPLDTRAGGKRFHGSVIYRSQPEESAFVEADPSLRSG
jgi:hypothetical protein